MRADFPHTASLVKLVSLVSFPYSLRSSFALIPTDIPRSSRAVSDAPPQSGLSPLVGLSTITFFSTFDSYRFILQVEALRSTGIAPLRHYYGLVRLLRPLSLRRPPKFTMQLSRRAAPLYPAMLSTPQIDFGVSSRLHAD